ncbi:MAG: phosphoribosylaminoimidazolesuccinocarboxamide synthase [Candidatus Paceibacterota bacterium]
MVICTLEKIGSGKVRDIYAVTPNVPIASSELIGFVATDRVSVNDNIVGEIPGRGRLLNLISNFWKKKISRYGIIDNDLFPNIEVGGIKDDISIVKKAIPIPIELIVRNILTGSIYNEYQRNDSKTGKYLDIELPAGLKEWDFLPKVSITPTTKAALGKKDEPICYKNVVDIINTLIIENKSFFGNTIHDIPEDYAEMIYSVSLQIFDLANQDLQKRGIILVDTKFEFGFIRTELGIRLILIDEVLTPDSSRFILEKEYNNGIISHLSKQTLRNWILKNPGQSLSEEIKKIVYQEYYSIYERIVKIPS